eukprot:Skav233717  [mRNA]  locus=scaffold2120:312088:319193:+ [translate_table: standard]
MEARRIFHDGVRRVLWQVHKNAQVNTALILIPSIPGSRGLPGQSDVTNINHYYTSPHKMAKLRDIGLLTRCVVLHEFLYRCGCVRKLRQEIWHKGRKHLAKAAGLPTCSMLAQDEANPPVSRVGTLPWIIEDGELDVMEASWSSWAEEEPGPNSPPTRRTHEAYNKALDRFLRQVDRKPKRRREKFSSNRSLGSTAVDRALSKMKTTLAQW